jgi:hypothetical protein
MRRRTAVTLSVASAGLVALGATSAACFDLFHSTSDILTACEIDAQSPACGAHSTDFCAWSPPEARQHAAHACGWLGACETPMGRNALGPCMFEALLAYDCAANPNHQVKDPAHALWDCLWQAQSCDDVSACILPGGPPTCQGAGDVTACADAGGAPESAGIRIACDPAHADAAPPSENCALWGQTCASAGGRATCSGDVAGYSCAQSECFGNQLRWCDGGDVGIDCTSNGAGRCSGFPKTSQAAWVACVAESDAGACPADLTARCTSGRAVSCPSGVLETINCQSLLGGTSGACQSGPLNPAFDWTSPCVVKPPECTSDSCASDGGGGVIGCARGAKFVVDCASEHLGACRLVSTELGTEQHAACSPP